MVYSKYEGNLWRVPTCRSDSRYIDKKTIRKVVRKTCAERRKITLLKGVKIRKQFDKEVTKFVDLVALNLWGHFKDGVLEACDEVCGKKGGGDVKEILVGGVKR